MTNGPLSGLKLVEFAGLGPTPYCGMLLADMGAERILIDRPAPKMADDDGWLTFVKGVGVLTRGSRSICVNLKSPEGREVVRRLLADADILLEGYRPGVMEKLGFGPAEVHGLNARLVYARMTGWGQTGTLAMTSGHDINYLALSGALHLTGRQGRPPVAPPALLGDFGAGGSLMAFGIVCAVLEAWRSGTGQVVDGSVLDGAALTTHALRGLLKTGQWRDRTGENVIDSGAYFYDVFECADGRYISVGALEPQFYAELLEKLELDPAELPDRFDRKQWPHHRAVFSEAFRSLPRDSWAAIFEGSDACVAPVLSLEESPHHPHNAIRGVFFERDGAWEASPAPRFSRTPPSTPRPVPTSGQDSHALLLEHGYSAAEAEHLLGSGAAISASQ